MPEGIYEKILGPLFQQMLRPMTEQMTNIPVRDLARAAGVSADKVEALGNGKLNEVMAIVDPAFRQRMDLTMSTMFGEMGPLLSQFEPEIREGMAAAYANQYSAGELDAINAFLTTPTGAKFGGGFMTLATDPNYLSKMQAMMPRIMEAMPAIIKKVGDAVATLPKPRTYAQLSKAERTKLAELLGVDPKTLKK